MANVKNLRAGFTGNPEADRAAKGAKQVAGYVRDEARAVARSAREHPSATSTALLAVGLVAFVAGYLLGSTPAPPPQRSRFW